MIKSIIAVFSAFILIIVVLYQERVETLSNELQIAKNKVFYIDSVYNENLKYLYNLDTNYYFVNKKDLKMLHRLK